MKALLSTSGHRWIAAFALTALAPVQAWAAPEQSPEPKSDAAVADSVNPNDILVTARRSSERLQDVPVAVTAVSPLQVRTLNISDTRDLVKIAPGLGFAQGSTTKILNFVVRGISTFVNSDGFDQSVGVAFDGVSLARPGGSIADLIDIERVEILEGPQGMLFGRNASAGLVNIISKRPVLSERSLAGRISYGSYDDLKTEVAANVPIGDTFALRAVGWDSRHGGYVKNIRTGDRIGEKNSQGLRLRTLWEPTPALSINLMGEYVAFDQDPSVLTIKNFNDNLIGIRDYETAQGIVPSINNNKTSSTRDLFNKGHSIALSGEVAYDLGGPSLTFLSSYRKIRVRDKFDPPATSSPTYVLNNIDDLQYHQVSEELRLNSDPGAPLKYVFGLIYFDMDLNDDFTFNQSAGAAPVPLQIRVFGDQRSKHYAGFGEVTVPIVSGVRAIAGGRWSWDRVSGGFDRRYLFGTPAVIVPPLNAPGAVFGPLVARSSVKDSEPSYRVGLQWDAASDIMLYGTVSRGYKAAGLDLGLISAAAAAANQLRVKPEISMNYELGLRSQFFNRRLTFNLTAFHEVFSDFQISTRVPVPGIIFAVQNAKQLKSTGVQITTDARITDQFTLSASGAYTHARYTNFNDGSCYPREPTAPAGTPLSPGLCVNGVQSLNGLALQNAPRWKGNVTARYEQPLGDDMKMFGQVNASYQSKEVFNAVADPNERQGGYTLVNLSAGFGPQDGSWQFSVYGSNIFDQKFIGRTVVQNQGSYYVNVVPYGARARFGASFEFKF